MCPPSLKTCSWVIAQFNSLWRQRLTSVAFPCVLTQDEYRRLRNLRRVFLQLVTVSIRGFISFGKWRTFLTVRCKNWCQEISAYKLVNKLFKVVFLALLAGVQNMREIMLIQWLQFRSKLLKERITLIQRIFNAVQLFEKLMFFRQNTYKNSRIWCSQILKHRSIDFIVRFVGGINEAIFCLPLFIFIIYCKVFRFFGHSWHSMGTFLEEP